MATRVTDGARRERHEKRGCRPRFARLAASPLPRACIALRTKSEEKERLLAVTSTLFFFFQRDGESFLSEPDFRGKYSKIRLTRCIFLNLFAQDCRLVTGARWPSAAGRCSFLTISQKNREIVECVQSNHNNSVEIFFLCRL